MKRRTGEKIKEVIDDAVQHETEPTFNSELREIASRIDKLIDEVGDEGTPSRYSRLIHVGTALALFDEMSPVLKAMLSAEDKDRREEAIMTMLWFTA